MVLFFLFLVITVPNFFKLIIFKAFLTLKFSLKAGENDKLFGSVTSQMISEEIENLGYSIDKKEIILEDSLKEVGNHFVYINLGEDLKPKVKIKINS